ncbi:MAG: hypothetical protein QNK04_03390 [Myxococcota bacterium]|nr:hypothetical protein [Myxococcota bacterium]
MAELAAGLEDVAAAEAAQRALLPFEDRHAAIHAIASWGPVARFAQAARAVCLRAGSRSPRVASS